MEMINRFIVNDICRECGSCTGKPYTFIALYICGNIVHKSYEIRAGINTVTILEFKPAYVERSIYLAGCLWLYHDVSYDIYKRCYTQNLIFFKL